MEPLSDISILTGFVMLVEIGLKAVVSCFALSSGLLSLKSDSAAFIFLVVHCFTVVNLGRNLPLCYDWKQLRLEVRA